MTRFLVNIHASAWELVVYERGDRIEITTGFIEGYEIYEVHLKQGTPVSPSIIRNFECRKNLQKFNENLGFGPVKL